jgi:hypothetical protein
LGCRTATKPRRPENILIHIGGQFSLSVRGGDTAARHCHKTDPGMSHARDSQFVGMAQSKLWCGLAAIE